METQKFKDMQLGQRFWNCEVGGSVEISEYVGPAYKVSDTEAVDDGIRVKIKDIEAEFELEGRITVNTAPTDIERAAITLLYKSRPNHPALRAWVKALGTNPHERRRLEEFALVEKTDEDELPWDWDGEIPTIAEYLKHLGLDAPKDKYSRVLWDGIFDESWGNEELSLSLKLSRWLDKEILLLASEVRNYRELGRPAPSEYTTKIMGMGGPLMNVETSLPAKVAEYHEAVLNAHAWYWQERELEE